MQKNSITNKITPCCGLPFSIIYWWVKNLTLNSEADRQYLLTQISQSGVLSIDGWKVLIKSGTLEADASLTKAEFLAWFNCGKQPNCEQLKLIIEGYKVGNWTPETELPLNLATIDKTVNGTNYVGNVYTKTETDFLIQKLEKKSEALYTDDTLAGDILKRVDKSTGENINYRETTTWNDGSAMDDTKVDGVIYIKRATKYYKRVIIGYADPRWFGAKGDGVDKGIGNYEGDHDAINSALRLCKKVKLESGTFIVKKPIVLNDGNELLIDGSAVLKLGDAANCTIIKNSHVDLYKDALGNPTYPVGFKKHKNITIHGNGVIDGNGWMQNRGDDPGIWADNPAVLGTPSFSDGSGIGSYYFGAAIKLADIENLTFENLTIRNARTYAILVGGLRNFKIKNLIADRTYQVVNQDFLHLHGDCYDGEISNIYGVSGDDLIAVTTRETAGLTLRRGDVKRIKIFNVTNFGVDPTATPSSPKEMSPLGIESGFRCHRPIRLSYSGDDIIDDVLIDNINCTTPVRHCPIVLSNLPFSGGSTEAEQYAGTGYIGKVVVSNINQTNSIGIIGTSDYVKIQDLTLTNIIDVRSVEPDGRSILAENENFLKTNPDFTHSIIENLKIINLTALVGAVNPTTYIKWRGKINRLFIDNISFYSIKGTSGYYENFIRANVKDIVLRNSKMDRFNKIFNLTNQDGALIEKDCRYFVGKLVETQLFLHASSNTLELPDNSTAPYYGLMALSANGLKQYTNSGWVFM